MVTRRGFLSTVLALGAAPAIVRADSLMPLWLPRKPTLVGVDLASGKDVSGLTLLMGELGRIDSFEIYSSRSGVMVAQYRQADAADAMVDRALLASMLPPDDPGDGSYRYCLRSKSVLR